jgi:uncharacterized protein YdaU (DUF1376 family)
MKTWYQHFIVDWMDSTANLDDGAYRVYHVIIQKIYENEGPLTHNETALAGLCKQHPLAFRKNLKTLIDLGKLRLTKGKLTNDRARIELKRLANLRKTKQEAGEASGKVRRGRSQQTLENKESARTDVQQPASLKREEDKREEKKDSDASASESRMALNDWPKDFREQFWKLYPNKVGKPKALEKLDRVRKRGAPWLDVIEGLKRYIAAKPVDRAWLNPETFLNQERWLDQPAAFKQSNRGSAVDALNRVIEKSVAEDADRIESETPLLDLPSRRLS